MEVVNFALLMYKSVFLMIRRCLFILFMCYLNVATAQGLAVDPHAPIKNLKLVKEETDGKGNITRVVQYNKGNIKVTETILITKGPSMAGLNMPIRPDTLVKSFLEIVVSKSQYRLALYYRNHIIRLYKAVFGPNPMLDKCMEGDRCTPEGGFRIASKNPASKYNKFMLLSYPNDSATIRFNRLKAAGKIPANARIGGDVGIHGIWKGGDDMIELGVGWTDGCVALKNKDIEELFSFVGVGTKVTIKR